MGRGVSLIVATLVGLAPLWLVVLAYRWPEAVLAALYYLMAAGVLVACGLLVVITFRALERR